jgi:hypothetical protein
LTTQKGRCREANIEIDASTGADYEIPRTIVITSLQGTALSKGVSRLPGFAFIEISDFVWEVQANMSMELVEHLGGEMCFRAVMNSMYRFKRILHIESIIVFCLSTDQL